MGGEITDLELTKRYRARLAARGLSAQSYYQDPEDGKKKRVGKACDSCRNKKTKCDGRKPCSKCSQDNKICVYSEKKKLQEKTYSSSYVELLECRIQILQDSLYKVISKIGKGEPVDHYVPRDDDYSINHVIDLVMREDELHDGYYSNEITNEAESPVPHQSSSEADSPDQAPLQLDLGPYKSGAAMAAAAAAGHPITLPNSPTSTIASSPESSSDLYYSNFTPPDSISPQLLDGNNRSSSFTSLSSSAPHKLGRRGSAGHLSKVHKAGSHFHQHPNLSNYTNGNSTPYNRPNRHSVGAAATMGTTYNDEYDNDDDLMSLQSGLGNLVKMEEVNGNFDDLWLGVPPN